MIQRFPTSAEIEANSSPGSSGEEKGFFSGLKQARKTAKGALSGNTSIYQDVLREVDNYNTRVTDKLLGHSGTRKAIAIKLDGVLTNISQFAANYVTKHNGKADRQQTINTFRKLIEEVAIEKAGLQNVIDVYGDNNMKDSEVTDSWRIAIDRGINRQFADLVAVNLGLPRQFLQTLNRTQLQDLLAADSLLNDGALEAAQALFKKLEDLPGFGLIKSNLIRKHIDKIDPDIASMLNDKNYKMTPDEYKKKDMLGKPSDAGFNNNLAMFKQLTSGDSDKSLFNSRATKKGIDINSQDENEREQHQAFDANFKEEIGAWQNTADDVDLTPFEDLDTHEKSHLTKYSGDSDAYIKPIRGINPTGMSGMVKQSIEQTVGSLASALNQLPDYSGPVYRHDNIFPGFKELMQPGATLADMAPVSTTKEAATLKQVSGRPMPDVLSVIVSKTGKYISPASNYNAPGIFGGLGNENEVLFKPGSKFQVLQRFDATNINAADGPYVFPDTMPAILASVLKKDQCKNTIKIIILKQEV